MGRRRAAGKSSSSQQLSIHSSMSSKINAYVDCACVCCLMSADAGVTLLDMLSTSRPHGPMHAERRQLIAACVTEGPLVPCR